MRAMNFRGQGVSRATGADLGPILAAAQGIAHLHDDVREHAVDAQTIVEPLLREFLEIGDRLGRIRFVELDRGLLGFFVVANLESEQGNIIGADAG